MGIKTASYVKIRKGTKLGHMGPQDYYKISIVTHDYTFSPEEPIESSFGRAVTRATNIAEALEMEVIYEQ